MDMGSVWLQLSFLRLWFMPMDMVWLGLCSSTVNETWKWLTILLIFMQESFWRWLCSFRYSFPPPPPGTLVFRYSFPPPPPGTLVFRYSFPPPPPGTLVFRYNFPPTPPGTLVSATASPQTTWSETSLTNEQMHSRPIPTPLIYWNIWPKCTQTETFFKPKFVTINPPF